MLRSLALAILICLPPQLFAAKISGTVKDAADNSALSGVVINIKGTAKGAVTDLDGNYEFKDVADGEYVLVFSMMTYDKLEKTVTVKDNKDVIVDISLKGEKKELKSVNVAQSRITRTENAVIMEMKKSTSIVSGISSQQIAKTMDRNAADVVKRIPGVTVQEDRFIIVRGLSDRYNAVWLNDAGAPSSEVDKRSFSFDMVPSGLIDRILISKTPSPEMPSDFAGGMVKIYTTSMPDKNFISAGVQGSYREGSTSTTFNYEEGSKTDWLGYDDGKRQLPTGTPDTIKRSKPNIGEITKAFGNDWILKQKQLGPDGRFNLSAGIVKSFGKVRIGNTFGSSYSNVSTNYNKERQDWDTVDILTHYFDAVSENKANAGLLNNTVVSIGNSKFEFKNLYNQQGKATVVVRSSARDTFEERRNDADERSYMIGYESRASYCSQLSGTHKHAEDKWKYNWTMGYTDLYRDQPDMRRIKYNKNADQHDSMFKAQVQTGVDPFFGGGRFFSKLFEHVYSFNHQFTYTFKLWDKNFDISAGNYVEYKSRKFAARNLSYTIRPGVNSEMMKRRPLDEIFADSNVGDLKKFLIDESTNRTDKYFSTNQLIASYLSAKIPIGNKISVLGGVRYEHNTFGLIVDTLTDITLVTKNFLPSINATYNFSDKSLFRAAYGRTLNRPEVREQAPFSFFDFELRGNIYGALNPNAISGIGGDTLDVATIDNFDVRWEWYPETGEMVHVGLFYKDFKKPIQRVVADASASNRAYSFANIKSAYAAGIEIDVRKNLGIIDDLLKTNVFNHFSIVGNIALIKSEMAIDSLKGNIKQLSKSPLVGQSLYMYNVGLFYQYDAIGLQGSILYNVFGPRVFALGTDNHIAESIFEMPFRGFDFTIQKTFFKHYSLNFGVQNLLNSRNLMMKDINRDNRIDDMHDRVFESYYPGRYYSLGVKVNF
jgi:outer membrane receptor protein involved in Fe transport